MQISVMRGCRGHPTGLYSLKPGLKSKKPAYILKTVL